MKNIYKGGTQMTSIELSNYEGNPLILANQIKKKL